MSRPVECFACIFDHNDQIVLLEESSLSADIVDVTRGVPWSYYNFIIATLPTSFLDLFEYFSIIFYYSESTQCILTVSVKIT